MQLAGCAPEGLAPAQGGLVARRGHGGGTNVCWYGRKPCSQARSVMVVDYPADVTVVCDSAARYRPPFALRCDHAVHSLLPYFHRCVFAFYSPILYLCGARPHPGSVTSWSYASGVEKTSRHQLRPCPRRGLLRGARCVESSAGTCRLTSSVAECRCTSCANQYSVQTSTA
jgi:hypothetical protein